LDKLIQQTLNFIDKNNDIKQLNNYLDSRVLDWRSYCDKFNPENRYSPSPDAYIDNLIRYVKKEKV